LARWPRGFGRFSEVSSIDAHGRMRRHCRATDCITQPGLAMPYVNLKLTAAPSEQTTHLLGRILTDLTADVLKKKRELTAVVVEYLAPDQWLIGAKSLAQRAETTICLEVTVTDGTNSKDEKAEYISKVFAALESILGPLNPASYIIIQKLRADAWGYGGVTQELRRAK
jgi:4-oxalocrotonate tautomerase